MFTHLTTIREGWWHALGAAIKEGIILFYIQGKIISESEVILLCKAQRQFGWFAN